MRAVIQRVASASVVVNGGAPRTIGRGIVILLGVRDTDTLAIVPKLAEKCAGLRIFEDEEGKLNRSARELGLQALVVSNFTLYGDTRKGKRPSFIAAAKPPLSVDCYNAFVEQMRQAGLAGVQTGEFGADMQVSLVNDGPITIVIDTDEWTKESKARKKCTTYTAARRCLPIPSCSSPRRATPWPSTPTPPPKNTGSCWKRRAQPSPTSCSPTAITTMWAA